MVEGIEPFYKVIADSMVESIPEPWTTASIAAIFFTQSISYSGEYLTTEGKTKSFPTNMDGERAFRRIRDLFVSVRRTPSSIPA